MLPTLLHPLVPRLFNALLARESWAASRLRPHAGKAVRLALGAFDVTLAIGADGRVDARAQAAPNVTVTVAAADLPRLLAADAQQRMQAVRIEGESALAHVVADLARDLRWDVEDELAGLVGDIPARGLVRALRGLAAGVRQSGARLTQNAAEYATHEANVLVSRAAVAAWANEVAALDAATEAVLERAAALQRIQGLR